MCISEGETFLRLMLSNGRDEMSSRRKLIKQSQARQTYRQPASKHERKSKRGLSDKSGGQKTALPTKWRSFRVLRVDQEKQLRDKKTTNRVLIASRWSPDIHAVSGRS